MLVKNPANFPPDKDKTHTLATSTPPRCAVERNGFLPSTQQFATPRLDPRLQGLVRRADGVTALAAVLARLFRGQPARLQRQPMRHIDRGLSNRASPRCTARDDIPGRAAPGPGTHLVGATALPVDAAKCKVAEITR